MYINAQMLPRLAGSHLKGPAEPHISTNLTFKSGALPLYKTVWYAELLGYHARDVVGAVMSISLLWRVCL